MDQVSKPAGARLPLRRPRAGRVVGGVCRGVAIHLDVRLALVRWAFVVVALLGGAGVAAYVFLWVTVPEGDAGEVARSVADPTRARAANAPVRQGMRTDETARRWERIPVRDLVIGAVLLFVAVLLVGGRLGWNLTGSWLLPLVIVVAGALLAWSQLDGQQRDRLLAHAGGGTRAGLLRLGGGVALVSMGVLLLVWQRTQPRELLPAAIAAVAVLVGAALVLAPWWLRLLDDLGQERAARERADERAEIAAHLHDSVLQTLALIQRSAHDPAAVARVARTQERELRGWLYQDKPRRGTSVTAELSEIVAEVEDLAAGVIQCVVVGDAVPSLSMTALLRGTREALVNAARHGAPPFDVYLEADESQVEISVRDHGPGFELAEIPADRLGVRESIVGRIERHGGSVSVRRPPSGGTDVRMTMPLAGVPDRPVPADRGGS